MPHYSTWERAPYHPYQCVVCTHEASSSNPLVEPGRVIEDYGDVYLCKSCITSLAYYLNIVQDAQVAMEIKINEMNAELGKVPTLIERLVNGIRDLSISASADLLAVGTPVVLVNDKKPKQSDGSATEDEHGHDSHVKSVDKSSVHERPDSVPASAGGKRVANTGARKSSTDN
jgi:hypothetical protein